MKPIYLDYNATTPLDPAVLDAMLPPFREGVGNPPPPLDPAVLDAMLPHFREGFGNPSSAHAYGKAAHDAVERARARVAALLGCQPDEVVFTGGGTEAS